ncbi:MAG: glycosyltransferase [Muribaculaceae bacterium]|nr:glycosyltransferase [Muribaculaceae bacterium]
MEKKRILIANKFYYPRGGDCIVAMNLERLLKERGHDVAVLAMQYPENVDSGWNDYYPSQVDFAGSLGNKIKAAKRLMGWGDIITSFTKILDDFKPEIVHLHNIHSYLSPVLAKLAKKRGCQVVWTLHDYKLVCPSYACLQNGKPCEKCIGHSKIHVLKDRCMKGSLAASALAWLEARKWNSNVLDRYTDAFICPSQFMATKMKKDGFDPEKLRVVCNHIDAEKQQLFNSLNAERENYYVYVGRLSQEKGVETLLNVASKLPYTLRIAGDGPLRKQLEEQYASCKNIKFLGHQNAQQVAALLSKAQFSVVPSEWYENNPLSVIESLCAGTPVVGARIGGIPELLNADYGLTFTSGNRDELKQTIGKAFDTQWNNDGIKTVASSRFSEQEHLKQIEEIYGLQPE